jgi:hypothetical protein
MLPAANKAVTRKPAAGKVADNRVAKAANQAAAKEDSRTVNYLW